MVEFAKILKKLRKDEPETKAAAKPADVSHRTEPPRQTAPQSQDTDEDLREAEDASRRSIKPLFTEQPRPQPANLSQETGFGDITAWAETASGIYSSGEDTCSLYGKIISLAGQIFHRDVKYEEVDTAQIASCVAAAAGAIAAGDGKLIELSVTKILKDEESYLPQHSVNVCIISIAIGFGSRYEMGKLIELGIAAFLHDIGMITFEDMVNLPRKLTQQEYERIKNHVDAGEKILKKINHGLSDTILTVHYEIHERLDGSGYPTGRRIIHDYARIIALADAFESMIHPRPFRGRYSIMEVYKRIFDAKNKYDPNFIKVLVDRIGFFPNGTFVQLNTKEIARVIGQNPKSPLRPNVRVLFGENGDKLYDDDIKDLNLVKYPTLHVIKCFLPNAEKGDAADAKT